MEVSIPCWWEYYSVGQVFHFVNNELRAEPEVQGIMPQEWGNPGYKQLRRRGSSE
jgi:hypothetical protein